MADDYTPGPWFASPFTVDDNGESESCSIGPFDVRERPSPHHYEDTICEVWDGNHNGPANAALIAAAPDLLASLRVMTMCAEAFSGQFDTSALSFAHHLQNAKAAIARAEGAGPPEAPAKDTI